MDAGIEGISDPLGSFNFDASLGVGSALKLLYVIDCHQGVTD